MIIAFDPASAEGDYAAVAAICPICHTLYCENLEPGAEVILVANCDCKRQAMAEFRLSKDDIAFRTLSHGGKPQSESTDEQPKE